jgi:hypothetical protein
MGFKKTIKKNAKRIQMTSQQLVRHPESFRAKFGQAISRQRLKANTLLKFLSVSHPQFPFLIPNQIALFYQINGAFGKSTNCN